MASRSRTKRGSAVEAAARRARSLNERILKSASRGGETYLEAYENLLKSVADAQQSAGERSAEWVTAVTRAQADFTREVAKTSESAARQVGDRLSGAAGSAARRARRVPGVAGAEGEVRAVGATQGDLPIARYDSLNASEIVKRLPKLSETDRAKVDAYERRHRDRKTIRDKIASLED